MDSTGLSSLLQSTVRSMKFLFALISLAMVCVLASAAEQPISIPASKPNIIFILADDLGMQDVGFMGSQYFETPNLDKLADESLVFNQAYMYPTCSPSRAAILTGKQSFRTGCYTVPVLEKGTSNDNLFSRWTVEAKHSVYAKPLREAGYQLTHIGKWHIVGPNPEKEILPLKRKLTQPGNGNLSWLNHHLSLEIQPYYPLGRGFHENVGGTWWGDPARGYSKGYRAPEGGYFAPFKNPFIEDRKEDEWLTDRLTSEAIDFIDRHQDEPFFVNLHYYAPHRPSIARNQDWLSHFIEKEGDPITGQGMNSVGKQNRAKHEGKNRIAAYATMVKSIDQNIKRITDYLDQAGLRENTLLIFTSDNGFNEIQSCNNNLRGAKGYVYEGGIRVPAFINWPKVIRPARCDEPIHALDFFPTFLDLAGVVDYQEQLDGDSLVPLLGGGSFRDRPLFWHIASTYKNAPCSVIRKGDWKLIQFLKQGKVELYNLREDLKESHNLAKKNPLKTQALLEELVAWRKTNQVPLPPSSQLEF